MRRLSARLAQLELALSSRPVFRQPETDEEWLTFFDDVARRRDIGSDPDFSAALTEYRRAVEEARAHPDPPDDFMPWLTAMPEERLRRWQAPWGVPEVDDACRRLARMARGALTTGRHRSDEKRDQ
jgi:hypothetical protein